MLCARAGCSVSSPQNSGKPGASGGGDAAPSHLALLHRLCPAPAASAAVAWPEAQGLQTLGNSCHRFSLSSSLVLASALYRDKGKAGAPCLEVTPSAPATVLWLVPGEPVPTVPQPRGLSARKEAARGG